MRTDQLIWMPATELAKAIRDRKMRARDVAEAVIARALEVNPVVNALVAFDPDTIRKDADALDARQDRGDDLLPLHGVPYTVKDMTDVAGLPTTNGVKALKNSVAKNDAVVVSRLKHSGGLFIGKTNTPEMGYYGGTDNHLFGATHNPWRNGYTAGGSSGGAAAAVASGIGQLAEGTDGAGSVRIPAAMCGVVGLKPTTGVVPPTLPFLDWAYHGPLTRTVSDSALMLDVIAGHDAGSIPSVHRSVPSYQIESSNVDVRGLRIAWSADLGLNVHVDEEVVSIAREMVGALQELGAVVTEAAPNWPNPSRAMWHGIWVPAYSGLLANLDMDSSPGDFDERLYSMKSEGDQKSLSVWGQALVERMDFHRIWHSFMNDYDVIVSPTLASAAFPIQQFAPSWLDGASVREEILDWLLTYPFNMLNNPAITVPAGFTQDGRPVGLQIAARAWEDSLVLGVARSLERERPWAHERPNVLAGD